AQELTLALDHFHLHCAHGRIPKNGDFGEPGHGFFQQFQPFFSNSGKSKNTPVTCPPGREKLLIRPLVIGSDSRSSATIGMVVLAACAACTAAGLTATITSTLRSANSTASGAIRVGSPSAART